MLLTLMMTADGFFCVGHCGRRLGCPVSYKAVKVPPLCPFLWEETEIQRLELAQGLMPTLPNNCHSVCNEPLGDSVASGTAPRPCLLIWWLGQLSGSHLGSNRRDSTLQLGLGSDLCHLPHPLWTRD